jgi:hypothetical protein
VAVTLSLARGGLAVRHVAALYVHRTGIYSTPDVAPGIALDLWDEARDARSYPGPHPVVAHPPCARWCALAGLVEARYPHLRRGDDGGTFAAALAAVRRWGGVLEHPAYTHAWPAHGLPTPRGWGAWQGTLCGGWVCAVAQYHYGHRAPKATWLYASGVAPDALDPRPPPRESDAVVGYCGNRPRQRVVVERLSKRESNATPADFARVLVSMAATAHAR